MSYVKRASTEDDSWDEVKGPFSMHSNVSRGRAASSITSDGEPPALHTAVTRGCDDACNSEKIEWGDWVEMKGLMKPQCRGTIGQVRVPTDPNTGRVGVYIYETESVVTVKSNNLEIVGKNDGDEGYESDSGSLSDRDSSAR